MYDNVIHPKHYTNDPSGVECIEITRHRSFNVGNAIKYLWRAGRKDASKTVEDLQKAAFYVNDEIKRLGGTPNEAPTPQQAEPRKELRDGLYYIIGKRAIPTTEQVTEAELELCTGIGIKMGEKAVVVELHDAYKGDTELTTGECGSLFITNRHEAARDFRGADNTKDMAGYLHSNIELFPGQYIPSLGELYLMYLHFNELNTAIEFAKGEPLTEDWYWSSTQYSATYAWYLPLGNGLAYNTTQAQGQFRVRPVSAFIL